MPPRNIFLSPHASENKISFYIIKIAAIKSANLHNINVFHYALYGKCLTRGVAINEGIITGSRLLLSSIDRQIASPATNEDPASR